MKAAHFSSFVWEVMQVLMLQGRLAANITEEQGKTLVDAEGDVLRGLRKFADVVQYF